MFGLTWSQKAFALVAVILAILLAPGRFAFLPESAKWQIAVLGLAWLGLTFAVPYIFLPVLVSETEKAKENNSVREAFLRKTSGRSKTFDIKLKVQFIRARIACP